MFNLSRAKTNAEGIPCLGCANPEEATHPMRTFFHKKLYEHK